MLTKVLNWGLAILIFLLPLFFLPVTTEFYDFNKNALLLVACGLLAVLWTAKMMAEKRVYFRQTVFDRPVLLVTAAYLLSLFFVSTGKVEALMLPGETGTIIGLTILYFLITNALTANYQMLTTSLIASSAIISLIAIYQFFGVGEMFVPTGKDLEWLRAKSFSPTGNLPSTASFLITSLVLVTFQLYLEWKNRFFRGNPVEGTQTGPLTSEKKFYSLPFFILATILIAIGLGVTIYQLFTTSRPIFLSQFAGWVIALEAFKNFPFFGIGVENFVAAFTLGKPISFNLINLNQLWSVRFGLSSNFYFQILTSLGIVGLIAWAVLIWRAIKTLATTDFNLKHPKPFAYLQFGLVAIFVLFALFPLSFLLLSTTYLLLALLAINLPITESKVESKNLSQAVFLGTTLLILVVFYGIGRAYAAEFFFRQSLVAASQNRGADTYNLQIKTIQNNPYYDLYRVTYSQTNLALAVAVANKKDLTDADRQTISQLVQQSIAEAKAAVTLGPRKVSNWEILAGIYRNLINIAQGADQWAIAAYNQAVILDPLNPILRLNLGGVFYALRNYDEAIRQFTFAVNLKPDYANAHYNLSAAYREKGLIVEAYREMQQTQGLVEFDSNDYKKAGAELEDLKAKLPPEARVASPSGTPETLTPPASPSAKLKQPIELPAEAAPPPVASPSASPTASPSATVTPSPSATPSTE